MSSSTQPRISRPLLWLSIVVAALLAFELPIAWIAYSDRQAHRGNFLNFHPLFLVVYVPLAFGLLWPILIRIISWAKQRSGESLVWPAKTALVTFVLSACCSTPFVILEHRSYARDLEAVGVEGARMITIRNKQQMEKQTALGELQAAGVESLSEPLTGPQTEAVNSYLDAHSQSPLEIENAVRHYRTSLPVMQHLAVSRYCPGPALEIIFNNVIDLQKNSAPLQAFTPYEVLYDLAWNPNIPTSVLVKMLGNPESKVREAAAANPRLPQDARVAYLRRAVTSRSFSERERVAGNADSPPEELSRLIEDENFRVRQAAAANPNTPKSAKIAYFRKTAFSDKLWDRILAAESPDCPPEVLRQLALDPATAKYVASNPASPTDLLHILADADDPEICRRAVANLTKRQKQER